MRYVVLHFILKHLTVLRNILTGFSKKAHLGQIDLDTMLQIHRESMHAFSSVGAALTLFSLSHQVHEYDHV